MAAFDPVLSAHMPCVLSATLLDFSEMANFDPLFFVACLVCYIVRHIPHDSLLV